MAGTSLTVGTMTTAPDDVVLLAPEEETVPEDEAHLVAVDRFYAGLGARFVGSPDVRVFCRLAWFPDREDTRVRLDPDVMVVRGRPPGHRRSYKQWAEDGVAPFLLIEVVSSEDTDLAYRRRLARARRYGVQQVVLVALFAPGGVRVEHLLAHPDHDDRFRTVSVSVSPDQPIRLPELGIFVAGGTELVVGDEDGVWPDVIAAMTLARRAQAESARAQAESARAQAESARAERLAERLRAAGLDPTED